MPSINWERDATVPSPIWDWTLTIPLISHAATYFHTIEGPSQELHELQGASQEQHVLEGPPQEKYGLAGD